MRILTRVIEIVTKKDIDWMELFVGFITIGFCFCLLAPGDYFADSQKLHSLEHVGPTFRIPQMFWIVVFLLLGLVQLIAVSAGDKPFVIWVSRTRRIALNPCLIRMRVLAVGAGVWVSIALLAWPSASIWPVHLGHGLPVVNLRVSMTEWIFVGLFCFSVIAALRMAARWAIERDQSRRQEVMQQAEQLAALFADVAGIYQDEPEDQTTRYHDLMKR